MLQIVCAKKLQKQKLHVVTSMYLKLTLILQDLSKRSAAALSKFLLQSLSNQMEAEGKAAGVSDCDMGLLLALWLFLTELL